MVEAERIGVVKLLPVNNEVPPVAAENQFILPAEAIAERTRVPTSQRLAGVEEVTEGIVFIVAITAVLDAPKHPELMASAK